MGLAFPLPPLPRGRRGHPRLRLQLPAQLITLDGRGPAIVENVSATGAGIRTRMALRPGASCILRLPGLELLADIAWCAGDRCGMMLERELSQQELLAMRNFDPRVLPTDQDTSKDWARNFVNGTIGPRG